MSHSLSPNSSTPIAPLNEMLERLREEFPVFESDREKGDDLIGDMIAHWLKMKKTWESWGKPRDTTELSEMIAHWQNNREVLQIEQQRQAVEAATQHQPEKSAGAMH